MLAFICFYASHLHYTYTMPTPKILLYKHKKYSDGLHPIILQVVKNGKPIRKVIGKCSEKDWLPSKSRVSPRNIEAPRINNDIEKALRNFGLSKAFTLKALFESQIENYKTKQQASRHDVNQIVLNQLLAFSPNVDFEDVDEKFIYKFNAFLSGQIGNNPNTIKEKMNVFGAIMRFAKKQKLIVDNPFDDLHFAKVKTVKSKLTAVEIKKLMDANLSGKMEEARDIFMACIYLRGIRIGDLLYLKKSDIIDGRLEYTELKTGVQHNVGISPELAEIFERWSGKNKLGYIFSFLEVVKGKDQFVFKAGMRNAIAKIGPQIKRITKNLAIDKNVSPHTARHTFSKFANEVIKNTSITKDLIGHQTLAVHEGYISDISDDLVMDSYAKEVIDKIKNIP